MVAGNASVKRRTLLLILLFTLLITLAYVCSISETKPVFSYLISDQRCLSTDTQLNIIQNFSTFTNFSLVIAVQVHNRPSYLKELISSLSTSPDISRTFLIFSHDFLDDDINALISNITFCRHKQIFYPYSVDAAAFNLTNATRVSQVKLHWWWKANEVFRLASHYNYYGLVLFLEEDEFVVEDFMHVLDLLQQSSQQHCSNCVYSLGDGLNKIKTKKNKYKTSNKMSNMGLAFNATTWGTISACAESFCKYDDYNWDWSLNYIFQECVRPKPKALVMSGSRVLHIGKWSEDQVREFRTNECRNRVVRKHLETIGTTSFATVSFLNRKYCSGLHFNNKDCNATTLVRDIKDEVLKFSGSLYPKELEYSGETTTSRITKHFGGFSEKEDQDLCLSFASHDLTVAT